MPTTIDAVPLPSWIDVQCRETYALAICRCEHVREHQAAVLGQQLRALVDRVDGRLAICLRGVESCSMMLLTVLSEVAQACTASNGQLVILGMNKPVRKLFKMTSLENILQVARNERELQPIFATLGPARFPLLVA